MGIFERPKGSGTWWILYYHEGKRHREKVGPKKLALAAYQQRKTESRQGKFDAKLVNPGRPLTISELMERYWSYFMGLRSPSIYLSCRKHWSGFCGAMAANKLSRGHIERYQQQAITNLKPATVNRHTAYLRRCYALAIRDQLLSDNPFSRTKKIQENNARVRFLSGAEEMRLLEKLDERSRQIVQLAIHTGLRQRELFSAEWQHIDLEHGWLTVPLSKNGESRRVPLNVVALAIIKALQGSHARWLLPNQRETSYMDPSNWYSRHFVPALKAANITDFVYHDLRHTFCSRLVMAGVSITTVKELAGHKTLDVTLRYAHLAPEHQQAAVAVLEQGAVFCFQS